MEDLLFSQTLPNGSVITIQKLPAMYAPWKFVLRYGKVNEQWFGTLAAAKQKARKMIVEAA